MAVIEIEDSKEETLVKKGLDKGVRYTLFLIIYNTEGHRFSKWKNSIGSKLMDRILIC